MFVILDPGHGGSDPGGGSNSFWKEKDLNLKISKYQANRLNNLGIPNVLTRYNDQLQKNVLCFWNHFTKV